MRIIKYVTSIPNGFGVMVNNDQPLVTRKRQQKRRGCRQECGGESSDFKCSEYGKRREMADMMARRKVGWVFRKPHGGEERPRASEVVE